jgi:hypothetical protein
MQFSKPKTKAIAALLGVSALFQAIQGWCCTDVTFL